MITQPRQRCDQIRTFHRMHDRHSHPRRHHQTLASPGCTDVQCARRSSAQRSKRWDIVRHREPRVRLALRSQELRRRRVGLISFPDAQHGTTPQTRSVRTSPVAYMSSTSARHVRSSFPALRTRFSIGERPMAPLPALLRRARRQVYGAPQVSLPRLVDCRTSVASILLPRRAPKRQAYRSMRLAMHPSGFQERSRGAR